MPLKSINEVVIAGKVIVLGCDVDGRDVASAESLKVFVSIPVGESFPTEDADYICTNEAPVILGDFY